jgi:hypothetical protein
MLAGHTDADRATLPRPTDRYGRCRNPLACALADSGTVLRLAPDEPFFCPECARPLVRTAAWKRGTGRGWALALAGAAFIAGTGIEAELWLNRPPAAPPPEAVAHVTATTIPKSPPLVTETIPVRAPGPLSVVILTRPPRFVIPAPLQAAISPVTFIPAETLPRPTPAPVPPDQPWRLPGQGVLIAMPKPSADAPHPPGPPPPAASTATVENQGQTPPPADATPSTKGPRVIVLPAGSKLSWGPLQGVNLPDVSPRLIFTSQSAARTPGSIQVDCRIGLDGVPSDCRKVADKGAADVSESILAWLGSGAIRYSPGMKDGHKVAERRVLTVNFGGKAKPQDP